MMLLTLAPASLVGQSNLTDKTTAAREKSKTPTLPNVAPVMWKEPTDLETRDLSTGTGGAGAKPDLSSVTFIKQDTKGYSPKFRVRDGAGKIWVAKMGSEAQPETAAARLLWAVGYITEINHLVPCVQIQGAPKVSNSKIKRCESSGFANVKFEARPDNVERVDMWAWNGNPFAGTREFQGMVVLMSLINNWDLKDENNKILRVKNNGNDKDEVCYIVSDLGATFGKTGNFMSHTRNKPEDFAKSKFVERVERGRVRFDFNGKHGELFDDITVEQAQWIGKLLSRLSDKQIGDAFRAANYSPADVQILTNAMRRRINQLTALRA